VTTPSSHDDSAPLLSIVVPCRNSASHLPTLLDSLCEQGTSIPFEVVVVDNGSRDPTPAVARSYSERLEVRVVEAAARSGAGYAMNEGVKTVRSDAFVFIGSDDAVAPGYVAAMIRALSKNDVVASRLDRKTLNSDLGWNWRDEMFQHDELPNTLGFLPYAVGSGLGLTRRAFVAVGGFDATLPAGEDVDIVWRLQLAGFAIDLESDAVVRYRFRSGARDLYRQARTHAMGHVALYRKFASHGMPRRSAREVLRDWVALLRDVPLRPTRANWTYWSNQLGFRIGRIKGSLRYGVLYL